ncbi:hypothetical protein BABINDRAFT_181839 [Babjeviella inositovora NRRL Y-12698]|uniref:DNA-binding protein REB1 n=1 Tax=Babjeviella inositovora NRRL Y-12698 TaxID=984486 RepID=A0A1E3QHY1_9ASCO|nr:uncharacterized protein BABINDRAFT_181839 [Babjeviella inositovora NRRL Y-12698]ODQ77208.1 hypothetical protein BABINDRAFT_181839 [Babjeviella inositovora NRRL Y-12698]
MQPHDDNQELGAQALLQLLDLKKDEELLKDGLDLIQQHNEYSDPDKINEVEAAVLRYVGGTLDDAPDDKKRKLFSDELANINFQQWTGFLEDEFAFPGKRQKKKKDNVDPELAQMGAEHEIRAEAEGEMGTASEHEQLVQAAIMDARELASQLGPLDEFGYRGLAGGEAAQQLQQLQQHAAQAIAAADGPAPTSSLNTGMHANAHPEVAALVAAAAARASNWVTAPAHGKLFSPEEIEALDRFIGAYCEINKMTRRDICERVWCNERKKDDFWEALQKVLPHRSRASVYKHVRRLYHIFDVRGKWTAAEDSELGRLAAEKDGQWKAIGQIMGRMPEDCRDRWRNYVKCGSNRSSNKWSEAEEEKLRAIVAEILGEAAELQQSAINWTIVSERMGGIRSRIQCRYKWNKLLKREATSRAAQIDISDRIWLVGRIKDLGYTTVTQIDWHLLATLYARAYWQGSDFKICFERMRGTIRDFKKKKMDDVCSLLLLDLMNDGHGVRI